jgi:hypothetical protein
MLWVALTGCSPAIRPAAGHPPDEQKTEPAVTPSRAGAPIALATLPDAASSTEDAALPELGLMQGDDAMSTRWVKYTPTSAGLEINLDGGIHFFATASPFRMGEGRGVKVRLDANTKGATEKLANPKHGPLVFNGSLERAGHTKALQDTREGDEVALLGRKPISFFREWPEGSSDKPLTGDDKLRLEIGLWGVSGRSSADPLPWKYLFLVRASVVNGQPRVVLAKPEGFK